MEPHEWVDEAAGGSSRGAQEEQQEEQQEDGQQEEGQQEEGQHQEEQQSEEEQNKATRGKGKQKAIDLNEEGLAGPSNPGLKESGIARMTSLSDNKPDLTPLKETEVDVAMAVKKFNVLVKFYKAKEEQEWATIPPPSLPNPKPDPKAYKLSDHAVKDLMKMFKAQKFTDSNWEVVMAQVLDTFNQACDPAVSTAAGGSRGPKRSQKHGNSGGDEGPVLKKAKATQRGGQGG